MAYAQLRQHGVFASLEYVDRAMAEAGERSYVVREYVLALQRAHQPEAALRIAQQYPGLLSPMQHWELQADALAFSVRFADLSTRSEEERFAIADRTLQQYRQLLTQLQYAGAGAEPCTSVCALTACRLSMRAMPCKSWCRNSRHCRQKACPSRTTSWPRWLQPICTCASQNERRSCMSSSYSAAICVRMQASAATRIMACCLPMPTRALWALHSSWHRCWHSTTPHGAM